MEKIAVHGLAKGTTKALEKLSLKNKDTTKINGKPNVSSYVRRLIEAATGIAQQ